MNRQVVQLLVAVACVAHAPAHTQSVAVQEGRAPVIVVETPKGSFEFETYPNEAPKTVAHIEELVTQGFYDGQRVHRAVPGFVVQFGDPQ